MIEIYLHIGTHKTGSTAIQALFDERRDFFIDQGVYYPPAFKNWKAHHNIPWGLKDNRIEQVKAYLSQVIQEAQEFRCKKVFFSSEELEYVNAPMKLKTISQFGEVKVLCFVRRQDDYFESEYNQQIKIFANPFAGDIFQFFMFHDFSARLNHQTIMTPFVQAFGKASIHAVAYDQLLHDRAIFEAVFKWLGLSSPASVIIPGAENASLPSRATLYLSRLKQEYSLKPEMFKKAIEWLRAEIPHNREKLLPREYRARLRNRFYHGNKKFRDDFLAGAPLLSEAQLVAEDHICTIDYYQDFDAELYKRLLDATGYST